MFELRDVTAGYGDSTVLRDVTLAVPDGSIVALLGPNGAGKTTLLRVASGLLVPSSGDVMLDDVPLQGDAPNTLARRGVCHIPEGRGIFRSLSVRENLEIQSLGQDGVARATAVFPRLGERLGQIAGTMSGGEQQMLALARAYVQRPKVVLLDEVSMGLAPRIVDEIFDFIEQLAREGSSLLLVEQYVTRALAIADYVYLLNRGSVAFAGEPSELGAEEVFAQYVGADERSAV